MTQSRHLLHLHGHPIQTDLFQHWQPQYSLCFVLEKFGGIKLKIRSNLHALRTVQDVNCNLDWNVQPIGCIGFSPNHGFCHLRESVDVLGDFPFQGALRARWSLLVLFFSFLVLACFNSFTTLVALERCLVLKDSMNSERSLLSKYSWQGPSLGTGLLPVGTRAFSPATLLQINKLSSSSSNWSDLYQNSHNFE